MALTPQPMPARSPMIEPDSGLISRPWRLYLRTRADVVATTPIRVGTVHVAGKNASITPAVPVPMVVNGGLYRVSVFARRTTVAATSSALGVVIWFRSGGQTLSVAPPVSNLNTLTDLVTGSWVIQADAQSDISYEVAYGSVNPTEMIYSLDVVVEAVQA